MNAPIRLPDQAVPFLLLQRTDLKSPWLSAVSSKLKFPYHPVMSSLDTLANKDKIKRAYAEGMLLEYEELAPWLPQRVHSVLDIGCGIAGIDALLFKHFQGDDPVTFYLMDKSAIEGELSYGLKDKGEFYNSLPLAVETMRLNGASAQQITTIDVGAPGFVAQPLPGVDLVISLISWGYHYPVSVYLDYVYASLRPNGTLIIDVRKSSDGEKVLRERFGDVTIISETAKGKRLLIKKVA